MKMKKAKSTAAILAVMALTAGFSGVQAAETSLIGFYDPADHLHSVETKLYTDDVQTVLNGQNLNLGNVTGMSFANATDTFSVDANGNIKGHSFTTDRNSVSNIGGVALGYGRVDADMAILDNAQVSDNLTVGDKLTVGSGVNEIAMENGLISANQFVGESVTTNTLRVGNGDKFNVDEEGNITTEGSLSIKDSVTGESTFTVNKEGYIRSDYGGTIGGVTLNGGRVVAETGISAAQGQFVVDGATGAVTAANGAFSVNDEGYIRSNYGGTIGGVTLNGGRVVAETGISAAQGQFVVDGATGAVTAANGAFSVNDEGYIRSDYGGTIGGVTLNGGRVVAETGISAAQGQFVVDGATGAIKVANGGVLGNVAIEDGKVDGVDVSELDTTVGELDKNAVKWDDENQDSIHGVGLENGKVTADSASIGNILMNKDQILINGTTSLSKDGLVMNDGNGNAVYLGGGQLMVSGNIQAGSGTIGNVEIANGLVDGVDVSELDTTVGELDKNAVKWDDENQDSIHGVGLENGKVTADSASIGNILMNKDQILINGTTSLSKDGLVMNDGNGNAVYLGGGQLMVSGNIQAGSGTIGNVEIANGLVDGVDVSELAGNVSTLDQNAVKWDDENHNSINGVGLEDGNVTADTVTTTGDVNVGGDLNVDGSLTVGGETVATGADVSGIKGQIGVNEDGGYKTINNGASDVITGINNNTTAINEVKTTVGSGKLDNGAADLTSGINQNTAAIAQNSQAINSLGHRVSDLGDEIDSVGAISAALAGLHPLDYDGTGSKFQISAAMGTYDGTQAAAIGGFYHFNRDVMLSLGGATSFEGDKKTAANIGVTFRVGEGASGKSVSDDVMARLEAMDQKIAALEQENKDLKNVLGAIDTSLSKEFPDVPANHWAYEAVTKLAGNDVVAGYPDGEFHGDRTMTRYEMAEIIYKAMSKGVQVDQKLVNEFKPEMEQVAANQNA